MAGNALRRTGGEGGAECRADGGLNDYLRERSEGYGISSLLLGAGRNTKEDAIDYSAGIILKAKTGDYVKKGDLLATLYTDNKDLFERAEQKLLESTVISATAPQKRPLILSKIK